VITALNVFLSILFPVYSVTAGRSNPGIEQQNTSYYDEVVKSGS
jgi:hypothetical protein